MIIMKNKILKYSQVRKDLTKKQLGILRKSNETVLLDRNSYSKYFLGVNILELNTLIIKDQDIDYNKWDIRNCTAKDIYFSSFSNLGGLTIPFDYIINNNVKMYFCWSNDIIAKGRLEIVNILLKDKTETIELNNLKEIELFSENGLIEILVETEKSRIKYTIDSLGIKQIKKMDYTVKNDDIKNDELDLRNYIEFENVHFDYLKVNTLIINKEIIINKQNYYNLMESVKFNKLKIIDDSEMKLLHNVFELNTDNRSNIYLLKNPKNNKSFFVKKGDNFEIIFIDNKDEIKYIDKTLIDSDKKVIDSKLILDDSYFSDFAIPFIVVKYKNNKYKLIHNDVVYEITTLFKKFILLNQNKYIDIQDNKCLLEEDYFKIINSWGRNFFDIYNDYLTFKDRISKLLKLGFSYKALIYLYDRKINGLINTLNKDIIDYDKIEDYEIQYYNEIGKKHVKTLRKSGGIKNEND